MSKSANHPCGADTPVREACSTNLGRDKNFTRLAISMPGQFDRSPRSQLGFVSDLSTSSLFWQAAGKFRLPVSASLQ